ncbi:hypothetical protein [Yoonia rosea]|jgi:hypothetical protein|nr:hypothetical protein [Yoonia rosea]
MEFFSDLIAAIRDHPREVLICIAVPVVLALVLRGDGPSGGGWSDGDGGD